MAIPRKPSQPETSNEMKSTSSTSPSTLSKELAGKSADSQRQAEASVKTAAETVSVDVPANPPQATVTVPQPPPQPHPAVAVTTPNQAPIPVSDDDLPSILRRLTPIQRAKLRSAAISEGVIQSGVGRENSDGSISVTIRVDADLVPQLRTWAEEANKNINEQIQEIVGMLLSSYLMSPWEAPQPVSTAAAVSTGESVAK